STQHAAAIVPFGTGAHAPSFGAKYSSTITACPAVGALPVWVYFAQMSKPPLLPVCVAPAPVACVPDPVAVSVSAVTAPAPVCTLCAATSSFAFAAVTPSDTVSVVPELKLATIC